MIFEDPLASKALQSFGVGYESALRGTTKHKFKGLLLLLLALVISQTSLGETSRAVSR